MSSNYYGFTHAGTQYGSTYTPIPSSASTGYSTPAQMYSGGRPNYDQYQPSPVQSTYSYNRVQPPNNVGYSDPNQYQVGNTYPYSPGLATYTNSYNSVVTNYAASALYNQHSNVNTTEDTSSTAVYSSNKTANWNLKKNLKGGKVKTTNKVQQLHYCDVCKISCAGPQTYKEHLEGQRHKKKEAQLKAGGVQANNNKRNPGGGASLRCELCDVTCTGSDAYQAHIRGSKHQKVIKLHTKLGKPIPSTEPVLVTSNGKTAGKSNLTQVPQIPAAAGKIKVLGTPRINFVGGGRLHTTSSEIATEEKTSETNEVVIQSQQSESQVVQTHTSTEKLPLVHDAREETQPVGQDYVEEVKSDDGKVVSFHCKLCDCRFNDPNAKEMHLKGRRHRLQYKKKVDPNLIVDVKPSMKHRKQDVKGGRYFNKREMHYWNDWYAGCNRYGYDARYDSRHVMLPPPPPPPHFAPPTGFSMGAMSSNSMLQQYRRNSGNATSWDDAHILQKHSEICPKEEELDEIHHVVTCTERALKLVSDKIAEEAANIAMDELIEKELGEEIGRVDATKLKNETSDSSNGQTNVKEGKSDDSQRVLKGLMRVGALSKGLLLTGDREVDLVVICAEKPTKELLTKVVEHLPTQLQAVSTTESYEIIPKPHEASLSVGTTNNPKIVINVAFTSPLVRDINSNEESQMEMVKEPKQLLDRQKCLDALAALRHAKWFQARVANLQPCPIVVRILRDLCKRLPTWSKLSFWAVELLCEKVISSAGEPLTPGEALRHTFEAIASGLFLPSGAGLMDPCEKDPTDALFSLTRQEREDITASAQHALRLIAFRQIYKILGVDPLPQRNKKRRMESEADNQEDSDCKRERREEDPLDSIENESTSQPIPIKNDKQDDT